MKITIVFVTLLVYILLIIIFFLKLYDVYKINLYLSFIFPQVLLFQYLPSLMPLQACVILASIILVLYKSKFLILFYFCLMGVDSGDHRKREGHWPTHWAEWFQSEGSPLSLLESVATVLSLTPRKDSQSHCYNLWTIISRKRERDQQSSCSKCSISIHSSGHYPSILYALNLLSLKWEHPLKLLLLFSCLKLGRISGLVALLCFLKVKYHFLIFWYSDGSFCPQSC